MQQALTVMVPLFLFMLIPVWIPLIALTVGAILDRVRPPSVTPATQVVRDCQERSAARRTAVVRSLA